MVAGQSSWSPILRWHSQRQEIFLSLKTVFGPSALGSTPLLSSDGKTLIKQALAGALSTMLNQPSSVDSDILNQIPQQPVQVLLAKPPTIEENKKAIHQTISSRALGKDGIPAEIYKAMGRTPLGPSTMSCSLSGRRRWCQTTSAMPWSSPSIRKREVRLQELQGYFPPLSCRKNLCASHP